MSIQLIIYFGPKKQLLLNFLIIKIKNRNGRTSVVNLCPKYVSCIAFLANAIRRLSNEVFNTFVFTAIIPRLLFIYL